jgi:alpha-D-ribose 1-methylphosphonate 5-triphosphate synthase subunit PhnI
MGYVAVIGGTEAIRQVDQLNRYYRLKDTEVSIDVTLLEKQLRYLIDRLMSEGGMYAPELTALALKQAEGDPYEAAFLNRSYRSTLIRNHYSHPLPIVQMRVIRRISSTFREVPGGQILGPTYDYTHRILNFQLFDESGENPGELLQTYFQEQLPQDAKLPDTWPKVIDRLRAEGLLPEADAAEELSEPFDITRQKLKIPSPRSARLQALARGETGAMVALAYSAMRGYGSSHPTIGELRVGYVGVSIPHPYESEEEEDSVYIGEILLTEVETVNAMSKNEKTGRIQFQLGYGLCFGQNEQKAIAMAILDSEMRTGGGNPPQDEEFVLMHIDCVDSGGFVSHLKLPHYVTFQSKLDGLRHGTTHGKGDDADDESAQEE